MRWEVITKSGLQPGLKKSGVLWCLAFNDFPVEHWIHIRKTSPIESGFATIRHRTTRTKNCVSRDTLSSLVFQLALSTEKSWRKIRGFKRLPEVIEGIRFQDGIAVIM